MRNINLFAVVLALGCGSPSGDLFEDVPSDAGAELGTAEQSWATRKSAVGGRTWGSQAGFGNSSCSLTVGANTNCYFHYTNGFNEQLIKYWPHTEFFNSEDAIIASALDVFISNANVYVGTGANPAMIWSFQRLVGNTEPPGTTVVIRNKVVPAGEVLTTNIGQYVSVVWSQCGDLFGNPETPLYESPEVNGRYYNCRRAEVYFALNDLQVYMAQQGYTGSAVTDTIQHVLWHGLYAELGLGGVNTSVNSATRMTFSKTGRITSPLSNEEICRWRQAHNLDPNSYVVSSNTCS